MLGRPVARHADARRQVGAVPALAAARARRSRSTSSTWRPARRASCSRREQLLKGADEQLSPEPSGRAASACASRRAASPASDLSDDGALILVALSGRLYTRAARRRRRSPSCRPARAPVDRSAASRPTANRVAYVRDRDLYVLDARDEKRAPPHHSDATRASSNGLAEFVAQEEMDRFAGYWWSPDGKAARLRGGRQRARVETFHVVDVTHPESEAGGDALSARRASANVKVRSA